MNCGQPKEGYVVFKKQHDRVPNGVYAGSRGWLLAVACSLAAIPAAWADDQVGAGLRWFEVEVLIFKQRPQYYTDQEQFPLQMTPIPLTRHIDLLSQHRGNGSQNNRGIPALMVPCSQLDNTAAQANIARFINDETVSATVSETISGTISETRAQRAPGNQIQDRENWLPVLNNYQVDSQTLTTMTNSDVLCQNDDEFVFVDAWYDNPDRPVATGPREVTSSVIDGPHGDMYRTRSPFLLPSSSLQLSDLRNRLASQAGKQTLLHTAWRQPVFSRNQGRKIRIFGGENFSRDFEYLGFAREHYLTPLEPASDVDSIARQNDPLARIDRLLSAINTGDTPFTRPDTQALGLPDRPTSYPPNLPQDAWELDGLMDVYLVGNYLHVHGEFNLREEVEVPLQATSLQAQADATLRDREATEAFLRAYYFDQIRRMISHEVHYMDHPHLGVVVQIRRTELSARR